MISHQRVLREPQGVQAESQVSPAERTSGKEKRVGWS